MATPSPNTPSQASPAAGSPGSAIPSSGSLSAAAPSPGSAAFPPGKTYFDNEDKKSFADVPIERDNNNGIPTTPFLDAAESVVGLFDLLGSAAFKMVKGDMTGNIKKLRDRHLEAPNDSNTLQELVTNEIKAKKHTAAEGLVWLIRGFDFTAQALRRNINNPQEELAPSFTNAYKDSLKQYHNWFVQKAFNVAMGYTPTRAVFYAKLGDNPDTIAEAQGKWLQALEEQVKIIQEFQKMPAAKW